MPVPGERPVPPKRSRTRSPRSRTVSVGDEDRTSRGAESLASDGQIPCEEQICVRDLRDAMGYAVIDKNKQRDPPLPPTRPSIPRRRKSTKSNSSRRSKSGEAKFFTVPRPLNDASPPVRPLRNYSTLGPSRPPRRSMQNLSDEEEKENIDITQYIEITDDEPSARHLQSGEVIQKMKDRPLPAPPRPPRKTRGADKDALSDITHEDNIISTHSLDKTSISPTSKDEIVDEIEVSTQTDKLHGSFHSEEAVSERVTVPRRRRTLSKSSSRFGSKSSMSRKTPERSKTPVEVFGTEEVKIQSRPQSPTTFENEETITHATLLVQPVDNAQILANSYVSQRFGTEQPDLFPSPDKIKEMISEIIASRETEKQEEAEKEYDDDESSEIPESFKSLKDPPVERIIETKKIDDDDYSEIPEDFKKLRDPPVTATEESEAMSETVTSTEICQSQDAPIAAPVRTKRSTDKKIIEDDYAEIPDRLDDVCCPPPIETPPVRTKRKSEKKATEDETTEIPLDFHELRDPPSIAQVISATSAPPQSPPQPQIIERIIERQIPVSVIPGPETEVDLLRTQRLQVGDLDVERLNVSQLQAHKIVVTEIDGGHLQVNEISSKSGNLIVGGIEFPPTLIQNLLEKLQAAAASQAPPTPPPRQVINRQTSTDCPKIREDPVAKKESESAVTEKASDRDASAGETSEAPTSAIGQHPDAKIEETLKQTVQQTLQAVAENSTAEQQPAPIVEQAVESVVNSVVQPQPIECETVASQLTEVEEGPKETEQAISDEKTVESLKVEQIIVQATDDSASAIIEPSVEEDVLKTETVVTQLELLGEEPELLEPTVGDESIVEEEDDEYEAGSSKPQVVEEEVGQKKTSPSQHIEEVKLHEDSLTESESPLPSDDTESVVEIFDAENQLKKNLVEKLVDDIILVAEEIVEETLRLDESVVTISQTFPIDAAVDEESNFPESTAHTPQDPISIEPPTRPSRYHEVRFLQTASRSSGSEEVPQLIEIHHMEFTRSPNADEERPPALPPKQRRSHRSLDSDPQAPERPQLPAYPGMPYATSFYPEYIPSVPPPSFYSLRARQQEVSEDELPVPPRRRRHHRAVSRSSSEDVHHSHSRRRDTTRSPEPSMSQLSGQLARACVNSVDRSIKRLVNHIMTNVLGNVDGKQDLHVVLIMLLVLIAGLILLGFGGDKTVHLHHWEYFNPPRDL